MNQSLKRILKFNVFVYCKFQLKLKALFYLVMNNTARLRQKQLIRRQETQEIADIQYEIWATFLRSTGENLRNKQLILMAESAQFLDSFQNFKFISRQQDSTESSVSSHRHPAIDRSSENRFCSPEGKILSRKSPHAINKITSLACAQELKDLEENCNMNTIKWVKNLLKQHQKLKRNILQIEINEKRLKRNIENLEKEHEHLIILKKMHSQAQKKSNRLQDQVSELRVKNKALLEQINNIQMKNQKSVMMDSSAIANLTTFLNDKQKNINLKFNRIAEIQDRTLDLMNQFARGGCQKCCNYIGKVRDAINKFRRSLQQESDQIQNLYNRYKAAFCGNSY